MKIIIADVRDFKRCNNIQLRDASYDHRMKYIDVSREKLIIPVNVDEVLERHRRLYATSIFTKTDGLIHKMNCTANHG